MGSSPTSIAVGALSALSLGYYLAVAIYQLTLHPLAGFPGPRLSAISRLPYWWHCTRGTQLGWFKKLHERYGTVVRYGPTDLSYIDAPEVGQGKQHENDEGGETWQALHGFEKGRPEYPKQKEYFLPPHNGEYDLESNCGPNRYLKLTSRMHRRSSDPTSHFAPIGINQETGRNRS